MSDERDDRLDRFARRCAHRSSDRRPDPGEHAKTPESEPETLSPDRYSRSSAVKLAIAGVGSLALGVSRVSPASAMTKDECVLQCWQRHIDAASRATRACQELFDDPKSFFNTPSGGWARVKAIYKRGGWGFASDMAKQGAWAGCQAAAIQRMEKGMARCEDACEETCPSTGSRSLSRAAPTNMCGGTPPPRAPAPSAGPAPGTCNGTCGGPEDPCSPCAQVGGKCCYGNDPKSLCVCANPDYECKERYGCGD